MTNEPKSPASAASAAPDAVRVATTQTIELARVATRTEHDLLADAEVPAEAYWGVHTLRAVENFPITGVPVGHFPELVRALVLVKQAAARANRRLGGLPAAKADAIERACALIAKEGRTIPLNRISGVDFEIGVVDRLFGCGTLVVTDASELGRVPLEDIPRVEEVQRIVAEELHKISDRRSSDDGT